MSGNEQFTPTPASQIRGKGQDVVQSPMTEYVYRIRQLTADEFADIYEGLPAGFITAQSLPPAEVDEADQIEALRVIDKVVVAGTVEPRVVAGIAPPDDEEVVGTADLGLAETTWIASQVLRLNGIDVDLGEALAPFSSGPDHSLTELPSDTESSPIA